MSTYTITHLTRLANVGVVQVLEDADFVVGQSITIGSASVTGFDGIHTVISTESYELVEVTDEGDLVFDYDEYRPNQAIFDNSGSNVTRDEATGTVTHGVTCTWIDSDDVTEWLGIESATANDTAFIATCVSAANQFCYRRRQKAGYTDSLTVVPDGSVQLATVMMAGSLYRERGSVDSFASFEAMGSAQPIASFGRIMQLLGTGRAQVG
ncbi:MAG: hypothetical protein ACO3O3_08050 [Ilumatobacteraceae bacterium]